MSCEGFSNSRAILIHVWRRMWCHKTVRWVSVLNDGIPPPQHFTRSGPFFTLTSESAGLGKRCSETKCCLTAELHELYVGAAACLNFYCTRTDSFMLVLQVAFTETPKETLFTDPQRRVNGVLFMSVGLGACWTFKLAFSFWFPAAGQEGFVWIKHSVDIFSHSHLLLFSWLTNYPIPLCQKALLLPPKY